jgi:hypothetical protein
LNDSPLSFCYIDLALLESKSRFKTRYVEHKKYENGILRTRQMKHHLLRKLLTMLSVIAFIPGNPARTTSVTPAGPAIPAYSFPAAHPAKPAVSGTLTAAKTKIGAETYRPAVGAIGATPLSRPTAPGTAVVAGAIPFKGSRQSATVFVDVALLSLLLIVLSTHDRRDVLRIESPKI